MWPVVWCFAFLFLLPGCQGITAQARLMMTCQAYSDALTTAAAYRRQGKITPAEDQIITDLNAVLIGDPAGGKPGACTTPTPPQDATGVLGTVSARLTDLQQQLALQGSNP